MDYKRFSRSIFTLLAVGLAGLAISCSENKTAAIVKKRNQLLALNKECKTQCAKLKANKFKRTSKFKTIYYTGKAKLSFLLNATDTRIDQFKPAVVKFPNKYNCMQAKTKFFTIDILSTGDKPMSLNREYTINIYPFQFGYKMSNIQSRMMSYINFKKVLGVSKMYNPKVRFGDILTALDSETFKVRQLENPLGLYSVQTVSLQKVNCSLVVRPINATSKITADTVCSAWYSYPTVSMCALSNGHSKILKMGFKKDGKLYYLNDISKGQLKYLGLSGGMKLPSLPKKFAGFILHDSRDTKGSFLVKPNPVKAGKDETYQVYFLSN